MSHFSRQMNTYQTNFLNLEDMTYSQSLQSYSAKLGLEFKLLLVYLITLNQIQISLGSIGVNVEQS